MYIGNKKIDIWKKCLSVVTIFSRFWTIFWSIKDYQVRDVKRKIAMKLHGLCFSLYILTLLFCEAQGKDSASV